MRLGLSKESAKATRVKIAIQNQVTCLYQGPICFQNALKRPGVREIGGIEQPKERMEIVVAIVNWCGSEEDSIL